MFDKKQVSVLRYESVLFGITNYFERASNLFVKKEKNDNNKCRVFNFIYVHPRLKIAIISLTYRIRSMRFYSQITQYDFFFFFFEKMRQYKEERKSNKQSETSGPLKISCRWFL